MIINISDEAFKKILDDKELYLPIKWDGNDFLTTLNTLYQHYEYRIENFSNEPLTHSSYININKCNIIKLCYFIIESVNNYLNGFPSKAYGNFKSAMSILKIAPLQIYQKSVAKYFGESNGRYNDKLTLYRVTKVSDNKPYDRTRVFHTPYNMRSKVSASRYSIAGYPSLYLGTSLELCCKEINVNPYQEFALASIFKLDRSQKDINIRVIEMGIKPQDFLPKVKSIGKTHNRTIRSELLKNKNIKSAYLLWYPLIAACSFIRTNKNDPFAAEYIIPQLLMQWVREEICQYSNNDIDQLIGIRYFSSASEKASDMGFNYVFPTSGKPHSAQLPYCPVLIKALGLTEPQCINEYDSIYKCERHLKNLTDFEHI